MAPSRKQITFDLDTKALEKYYPSNSWRNAYEVTRNHMKNNGFSWVQGSAYVSEKGMSTARVSDILKELVVKHPWLNKCMRDCRETSIGKEFDKNILFDKLANIPTRAELQSSRDPKPASMSDWKARIAEAKANDNVKAMSEAKVQVRSDKDRSEQ